MVSFTSVAFVALAYVSCLVNATPLAVRAPLDVAAPPITYPTQGVHWTPGETRVVTWDTSKLPAQITNPNGIVVLGWIDSTGSYNLQLKSPLASGFPITAGQVSITVPSGYPDGNNYILALIGSSDNISPTFTIASGGGGGPSTSNTPNAAPSPTSTPPSQPSSNAGGQPSPTTTTTPGSGPAENNVATPNPTTTPSPSSVPSTSSSSTKSSSSSSPSGNSEGSNSSSSSSNAGWVNKPASTVVLSLLAGSLVTLFL